jgi:hypothetical protein
MDEDMAYPILILPIAALVAAYGFLLELNTVDVTETERDFGSGC